MISSLTNETKATHVKLVNSNLLNINECFGGIQKENVLLNRNLRKMYPKIARNIVCVLIIKTTLATVVIVIE